MQRIEIGASFNKAEMYDGMLVFTDLPELRSIRWKMGCFCYMQQIVFESEMKARCDPIDLPKLEEFEGPLEESSYVQTVLYPPSMDHFIQGYSGFLPSTIETEDHLGYMLFR